MSESGRESESVDWQIHSGTLGRKVFAWAVGIELLLVILDYFLYHLGLIPDRGLAGLFNLGRETSIPAWFSVSQTLFVGITLWLIVAFSRRRAHAVQSRPPRWRDPVAGWTLLALWFTYMAIDDGAEIHENIGSAFENAVAGSTLGERLLTLSPWAWQLVLVPVFGVLGVFMVLFLWNQLRHARSRRMVAVAFALLVVAVGLDWVEGQEEANSWILYGAYTTLPEAGPYADAGQIDALAARHDKWIHFTRVAEELLEMLAMTLLWVVFIGRLGEEAGGARIHILSP